MTNNPLDIFDVEDIDSLTVTDTLEDSEEQKLEIKQLEAVGNPRDPAPLKWTAEILLSDMNDPDKTLVIRSKTLSSRLPSARVRKNETAAQAAVRALEKASGIKLDSTDLLTRYVSTIHQIDEPSYMRSTWVYPYDLSDIELKKLDEDSYLDSGELTELLSKGSLKEHYTNLINTVSF